MNYNLICTIYSSFFQQYLELEKLFSSQPNILEKFQTYTNSRNSLDISSNIFDCLRLETKKLQKQN